MNIKPEDCLLQALTKVEKNRKVTVENPAHIVIIPESGSLIFIPGEIRNCTVFAKFLQRLCTAS